MPHIALPEGLPGITSPVQPSAQKPQSLCANWHVWSSMGPAC